MSALGTLHQHITAELREVKSIRDYRSGTFMVEGASTHVAFDLSEGSTALLATLV